MSTGPRHRSQTTGASSPSGEVPAHRVDGRKRRGRGGRPGLGYLRWRGQDRRGHTTWQRGPILAALALLTAGVLAFHRQIPDTAGNIGSFIESFLPWVGLALPPLLVIALLRRSATAVAALLVPTLLWSSLFGSLLTDKTGGAYDFTVVQHNVWAYNKDIPGTVRNMEAADPDVISLVEVSGVELPQFESSLAKEYPYRAIEGTVGLWSRYPVSDTEPVDLKIGWVRALRAVVSTPAGQVAVFVAHLPSVRVTFDGGFTANERDAGAEALGQALAAEELPRVILLGDLNGTLNDRSLAPVTSQLRSAQAAAGAGFGFTYPAQFPMTRIDQIMTRGVIPTNAWTLPEDGSDHLAIAAHIEL
ncbi:endonuclease/exonuclease/phosphatase family protein [Streptacidiphilus sp. MAP5-3]|uniref:endonuclease/exonuclease/phosphatase family protein n=1 Tax=unclassified Streptacidiphilus TaxID=2643834 RepID=UPI0035132855